MMLGRERGERISGRRGKEEWDGKRNTKTQISFEEVGFIGLILKNEFSSEL